MLLDILAGAIVAGVIPQPLRSRVSGAFMVVNNGVRPVGTALGGVLGTWVGVRTTLWIGTIGALAGLAFLLPSPIRSLQDVPEVDPGVDSAEPAKSEGAGLAGAGSGDG